jgi:S-adenosylmethionine:tRNA ribosyltransferase-isomerase
MSEDFLDYDLPPRLIAQQPPAQRDQSRLLVVNRNDGRLAHHVFAELPDLLDPRDLLVLNDTRVLAARLLGQRQRTGGKWEGLFLRCFADGAWELLCQTRGRLIEGETILVEPGALRLHLEAKTAPGKWRVRPEASEDFVALLSRHGQVPLPPYIRKGRGGPADRERYQTVYARQAGAVAAPTAGLHFTPAVFERLRQRGIAWAFVTLHVGLGTFQPIQVDDYTRHPMHAEWGHLAEATVAAINACRQRGGRVVAVGTTTVRVLEMAERVHPGTVAAWSGETDLFIYPPYQFRGVDALVTNFHLPRSTLLLLVGAFAGVDLLRQAYWTAIEQEYRFYSYGDAMLVF